MLNLQLKLGMSGICGWNHTKCQLLCYLQPISNGPKVKGVSCFAVNENPLNDSPFGIEARPVWIHFVWPYFECISYNNVLVIVVSALQSFYEKNSSWVNICLLAVFIICILCQWHTYNCAYLTYLYLIYLTYYVCILWSLTRRINMIWFDLIWL